MNRAQILTKLRANRKNPDVYKELSNGELADLVVVVLSQVDLIDKAIKEGRLDGYTPQPDKDYLSKPAAVSILTSAVNQAVADFDRRMAQKGSALESQVEAAIQRIRDGQDGIVTEEEIERAAEIAASLIQFPDFEALVGTEITRNGEGVRDALELLQGDARLSQEAVAGLTERLAEIAEIARAASFNGLGGTIGKQQVYGFIRQAIADGTISLSDGLPDQSGNAGKFLTTDGSIASWATISASGIVVATPTGTVNGVNAVFTVGTVPAWVVSDGVTYFENAGYTRSSLTITMDIAPSSYIRSIS